MCACGRRARRRCRGSRFLPEVGPPSPSSFGRETEKDRVTRFTTYTYYYTRAVRCCQQPVNAPAESPVVVPGGSLYRIYIYLSLSLARSDVIPLNRRHTRTRGYSSADPRFLPVLMRTWRTTSFSSRSCSSATPAWARLA